jgi:hypothetical protein
VVRAQEAVAQAVKGADPHATRADRQHRRDAREHFLRRLVGERDSEDAAGRHVARLDQPGDAGGEDSRLPRARAGEDQRGLVRQGDRGELLGVEILEETVHSGIRRMSDFTAALSFDENYLPTLY